MKTHVKHPNRQNKSGSGYVLLNFTLVVFKLFNTWSSYTANLYFDTDSTSLVCTLVVEGRGGQDLLDGTTCRDIEVVTSEDSCVCVLYILFNWPLVQYIAYQNTEPIKNICNQFSMNYPYTCIYS